MDRNTDIKNMDAPGVGSGKEAGDTILKGTASLTSSEKGSNTLEEYTVGSSNTGGASAEAKH